MESNCINVRLNNVTMGNVTGDAVHKAYAINQEHDNDTDDYKGYYRFDKSKNHFYTDLSIHNARSALDIGIISENVMCDNTLVTDVNYALHIFGADNCIISNLHVAKNESDTSTKKQILFIRKRLAIVGFKTLIFIMRVDTELHLHNLKLCI